VESSEVKFVFGILGAFALAGGAQAASLKHAVFELGCGNAVNGEKVSCDDWQPSSAWAGLPHDFDLTVNGLTANFAAFAIMNLETSNVPHRSYDVISDGVLIEDAKIGRYSGGAGVVNSPGDGSHTVDGSGWDDFIAITFPQTVFVRQIEFGFTSRKDDFVILTGGTSEKLGEAGTRIYGKYDIPSDESTRWWFATEQFGVGAFDHDDSWKLDTVKVKYEEMAPVPLPAAGWLLIAGLGGLAALRRKRA
jgi:hypothetical protein